MLAPRIISSLHRPFHRPLWVVKLFCRFLVKTSCVTYCKEDLNVEFYFFLLNYLHRNYPKNSDGVPSKSAVDSVCRYFSAYNKSLRVSMLKQTLAKRRDTEIEKQIYSTYKASSYYVNLAIDKLHFVDKDWKIFGWDIIKLQKGRVSSVINNADRRLYLKQILEYDIHFFLSQCLLCKYARRYSLDEESLVFDFVAKYYTNYKFDFTHSSHSNYYVVRKGWIEDLKALTRSNGLSSLLLTCIKANEQFNEIYLDILSNINQFKSEIIKKGKLQEKKKLFLKAYNAILKKQADLNDYVDLYDICEYMKMSYKPFNNFLSWFYEEERMRLSIFFINVVSTIDQRKRFYIRNTPVLKIKMIKL